MTFATAEYSLCECVCMLHEGNIRKIQLQMALNTITEFQLRINTLQTSAEQERAIYWTSMGRPARLETHGASSFPTLLLFILAVLLMTSGFIP